MGSHLWVGEIHTYHFVPQQDMVIALPNLALSSFVVAVAAAAVSSAGPIDVSSDYKFDPSDRVCYPYCGDDREQNWDISEGLELDVLKDDEEDRHLTKRSPLIPFPFPKKIPGKKLLKKLPFKAVKKLKKIKKLAFKAPKTAPAAVPVPVAVLAGGAGLAAGTLLGVEILPSLAGLPTLAGLPALVGLESLDLVGLDLVGLPGLVELPSLIGFPPEFATNTDSTN